MDFKFDTVFLSLKYYAEIYKKSLEKESFRYKEFRPIIPIDNRNYISVNTKDITLNHKIDYYSIYYEYLEGNSFDMKKELPTQQFNVESFENDKIDGLRETIITLAEITTELENIKSRKSISNMLYKYDSSKVITWENELESYMMDNKNVYDRVNLSNINIFLENVRRGLNELYLINFDFIPVFHKYVHVWRNNAEQVKYGISPKNKIAFENIIYNMTITNPFIAKNYYYRRNFNKSVIENVIHMMMNFTKYNVEPSQKLTNLICIIDHIFRLNNQMKYNVIIDILFNNIDFIFSEYHDLLLSKNILKCDDLGPKSNPEQIYSNHRIWNSDFNVNNNNYISKLHTIKYTGFNISNLNIILKLLIVDYFDHFYQFAQINGSYRWVVFNNPFLNGQYKEDIGGIKFFSNCVIFNDTQPDVSCSIM
jgi:hypothetical protein